MDECKPLPSCICRVCTMVRVPRAAVLPRPSQHRKVPGAYTLPLSAKFQRFLRNRGCVDRLLSGCLGGVKGYEGVIRVRFVSGWAQVELRNGRVSAPARCPFPAARSQVHSSHRQWCSRAHCNTARQGLTLIHSSAQLERVTWDGGCT